MFDEKYSLKMQTVVFSENMWSVIKKATDSTTSTTSEQKNGQTSTMSGQTVTTSDIKLLLTPS